MFQSLQILWRNFFEICRFRRKPQDLPASGLLLLFTLLGHTAVSLLMGVRSMDGVQALLSAILDSVVLVTLTWSLMAAVRHPERWLQTATALAGTMAILGFFMLLPLYWFYAIQAQDDAGELIFFPWLMVLFLGSWNLAVMAHILRNALSSGFFLGLLVAVMFSLLSLTVVYSIFPAKVE